VLHISGVLDSYTIGECLVSLPPECTDELAVKQNSAPYLRIRLEFSAWQEWTQDFLHSMDVAREMVPDIVRSPLAKAGMSLPRLRPRPRLDPQRARIRREMADIAAGAATLQ